MITLKVYNRKRDIKVEKFEGFSLNLRYDSVTSDFAVSVYYNPDIPDHKLIVAPGQYNLAKLEYNGKLIFTGFIINHPFEASSELSLVPLSGYSLAGVLEDSSIPTSTYPLQTDGLSLLQIAKKFVKPFDININVDSSVSAAMNKRITTSTAKAGQTVKAYLNELCEQRNIVLTHNAKGELLFTMAKTNQTPIFTFKEDTLGFNYKLNFAGQGIHSHITVIKQADEDGGNAAEVTITNPYVPRGVKSYRPLVVVVDSGDDISVEQAAKAILAAELKNITLVIECDKIDIDGKLILPNNTIAMEPNSRLYLFKKTTWFIQEVSYKGDSESQTCVMTCVRPECYNGKTPINIFV